MPQLNDGSSMQLLLSHVLDALPENIAVLDPVGNIVYTNRAWKAFSSANNGMPARTDEGSNYFQTCMNVSAMSPSDRHMAMRVVKGIREVMDGGAETFEIEYPCHAPDEERYFLLYAKKLEMNPDMVLTTHINITKRKTYEIKLGLMVQELASIRQSLVNAAEEMDSYSESAAREGAHTELLAQQRQIIHSLITGSKMWNEAEQIRSDIRNHQVR